MQGKFILDTERDFNIDLPGRIILTDNGAYDLELQGKCGHYVWIGFCHGKGTSLDKMKSIMLDIAEEIADIYQDRYNKRPYIEDFTNSNDMYRVYVVTKEVE